MIIRIALEMIGAPYEAVLVDRSVSAQLAPEYRALNPLGMIPALETRDGVIFETGAILLWLADRHRGLFPAPDAAERGDSLKWLFFISNSLHAGLRQMFYPEKFIVAEHSSTLRKGIAQRLQADFKQIDTLCADPEFHSLNGPQPSILDIYICACLRWAQLYPTEFAQGWLKATDFPTLHRLAKRLELDPAVKLAQLTEGLGATPFSDPTHANPPIGSAT